MRISVGEKFEGDEYVIEIEEVIGASKCWETAIGQLDNGEFVGVRALRHKVRDLDRFNTLAREWAQVSALESVRTLHDWGTNPGGWVAVSLGSGERELFANGESITALTECDMRTKGTLLQKVGEIITRYSRYGSMSYHGQVSPECVSFFDRDGPSVLVDDWGLSSLSATGQLTPYTAPEQLSGSQSDIDRWTDIYRLGALAFHVFAGGAPFEQSDELEEKIASGLGDEFFEANLPSEVVAPIQTAMAVDPENRPSSLTAFGKNLVAGITPVEQDLSSLPSYSKQSEKPDVAEDESTTDAAKSTDTTSDTTANATTDSTSTSAGSSRRGILTLGGLIASGMVGVGYLGLRSDNGDPPPSAVEPTDEDDIDEPTDDGDDGEVEADDQTGEPESATVHEDVTYSMMAHTDMWTELNWNPFAYSNRPQPDYFGLIAERGVYRNTATNELHINPYAFDEIEYDEENLSLFIELDPEVTYWNGDQYHAHDLATYAHLNTLLDDDGELPYESVEVHGEFIVEYNLSEPIHRWLIYEKFHLDWFCLFPATVWQPWIDQIEDSEEVEPIIDDLRNKEISIEDIVENDWGTSAYRIEEIDPYLLKFSLREDHRWVGDTTPGELAVFASEFGQHSEDIILAEEIDAFTLDTGNFVEEDVLESYERLATVAQGSGLQLQMNPYNRDWLADRHVRRGIAALIDFESLANWNDAVDAVNPKLSGMDPQFEELLLQDIQDDFIDYKPDIDLDLADEFLAEGGYERIDDEEILDSDGDELEPAKAMIIDGMNEDDTNYIYDILSSVGFPLELERIDWAEYHEMIRQEPIDWDMVVGPMITGQYGHPFEHFNWGTISGWWLVEGGYSPTESAEDRIEEWLAEDKEYSPETGRPLTPEIPSSLGSSEVNGDGINIDIYEFVEEWKRPKRADEDREIAVELARAWNFHVPNIDLYYYREELWGHTETFEWSETDLHEASMEDWAALNMANYIDEEV